GQRILSEQGVEHAVADLVAELVGVALGHALAGEEALGIGHETVGHRLVPLTDPTRGAGSALDSCHGTCDLVTTRLARGCNRMNACGSRLAAGPALPYLPAARPRRRRKPHATTPGARWLRLD